ncbi:unnamed protein product [Prunus armeniaca]
MVGPVNNQDGGDKTHSTRKVVTRADFETLSAAVEEVRPLLLGMGNQNPPPRPNRGAFLQCHVVERRPFLVSNDKSEEELHKLSHPGVGSIIA